MKMRIAFLVIAAGGVSCLLGADTEAPVGPTIELPKYTVTESRELPPPESWKHAEIPGFEILSTTSDGSIQRLLKDFEMFRMALSVAWPVEVKPATPVMLVLCGSGDKFAVFKPATKDFETAQGITSLSFRDGEQSAIILDLAKTTVTLSTLESTDGVVGAAPVSSIELDHHKQFFREYVRYLFSRAEPRPPAWFVEGMAQIVMRMDFTRTSIIFGKIESREIVRPTAEAPTIALSEEDDESSPADPDVAVVDKDFNTALQRRALLPWDKFFAIGHDSPEALNPVGNNLWAKQAYAFVHMCMYGRGTRYQKSFSTFIARASKEPVSEALFKECFGLTYKKMADELRGYIDFADYEYKQYRAKSAATGFPVPPPVVFRDATDAEVGRIKGEALRLAGNPEAARLALLAPYSRGERDPNLLASFGLFERSGQKDDRARKLLEVAAAGKTTRARAYLELGRMRFAEAAGKPAADGKFSPQQLIGVLDPAFSGLALPPALPEFYELIADAWTRSTVKPKPEHLGVLDQGIRRFPRRNELIYKVAVLKLQTGFADEAAPLIELGLKNSPDAQTAARFKQLKSMLKPAATP